MNLMVIAATPLAPPSHARPRTVMEMEKSGPESLIRRGEGRRRGDAAVLGTFDGRVITGFRFMAKARVSTART